MRRVLAVSDDEYHAPLPDDLGRPRRDHSDLAGIIVGGVLLALTAALLIVAINIY